MSNLSLIQEAVDVSPDKERRKELADKFPQMEEQFQEVKQEMHEPQIERLGETTHEQKQRAKKMES